MGFEDATASASGSEGSFGHESAVTFHEQCCVLAAALAVCNWQGNAFPKTKVPDSFDTCPPPHHLSELHSHCANISSSYQFDVIECERDSSHCFGDQTVSLPEGLYF